MTDSILLSILERIGGYTYTDTEDGFDNDVLMAINTALSILTQIGVGPKEGFYITGSSETWDEFITNDSKVSLEMVKDYVFLRVRMLFDTPTAGPVQSAYQSMLDELTWRINVAAE